MAVVFKAIALFAVVALCVSSVAYAEKLSVQGEVYCDTCRVDFKTTLSESIEGATVQLECKNRDSGETTLTKEGETDKSGNYKIEVEGDHKDDICEVKVVKSPREDCNELVDDRERVLLTEENGVAQSIRFANALGVLKKEASADCQKVLNEMGFVPLE